MGFRVSGVGFRELCLQCTGSGLEGGVKTRHTAEGARVSDWRKGFRVSDFGFRISGSWVSGFGFWIAGFGFRVSGFGFLIPDFGFRVSGFGFRVSGCRSRVSASGFQAQIALEASHEQIDVLF